MGFEVVDWTPQSPSHSRGAVFQNWLLKLSLRSPTRIRAHWVAVGSLNLVLNLLISFVLRVYSRSFLVYNKIFNGGLELISFPESRPKPSDFYTLFQTEMLKTIPKQPKYSNTQYPVEFPWSASFSSLGNEVAEEELTSSLRKTRGPSRRKKLREREGERKNLFPSCPEQGTKIWCNFALC